MKSNTKAYIKGLMLTMALTVGCKKDEEALKSIPEQVQLTEAANSWQQWTGVAVGKDNRIVVNFPWWSDTLRISVGEVKGQSQPDPANNLYSGPDSTIYVTNSQLHVKNVTEPYRPFKFKVNSSASNQ